MSHLPSLYERLSEPSRATVYPGDRVTRLLDGAPGTVIGIEPSDGNARVRLDSRLFDSGTDPYHMEVLGFPTAFVHVPRHRSDVAIDPDVNLDLVSDARCERVDNSWCSSHCPRHRAYAYALYGAKHRRLG